MEAFGCCGVVTISVLLVLDVICSQCVYHPGRLPALVKSSRDELMLVSYTLRALFVKHLYLTSIL